MHAAAPLKGAIETREVITVRGGGMCLTGTYHRPRLQKSNSPQDVQENNRIGILFLSGGILPRAATGDSAVYWADWLANSGYRAFRFDLPGIGDSEGHLSRTEASFRSFVDTGAYSPAVCVIADYLAERFNLRDIVVVGHCSGAVTALYAAASSERIKGLILLDPYFHAHQKNEIENALFGWHLRMIGSLVGDGSAPSFLRAVKVHSWIRDIYHHRKDIIPFLMRRKRLPSTTNLPLIGCWNQLTSRGIRILVLRSPSLAPKPGEFDYLDHLKSSSAGNRCISARVIDGTNHSFGESQGKEAVRKYAGQWLSAFVPFTTGAETGDTGYHSPEFMDADSEIDANVH